MDEYGTCPKCGGDIVGDGYTMVQHCENVDPPSDREPDSEVIYCDFKDAEGTDSLYPKTMSEIGLADPERFKSIVGGQQLLRRVAIVGKIAKNDQESVDVLLNQLKSLGVHPSGRKMRTDKGKSHVVTKTRSDKGTKRVHYNKDTAGYARRQFQAFIRTHASSDGHGDTLIRDVNMIFNPRTTHFAKTITVRAREQVDKRTGIAQQRDARQYTVAMKRPHHPEKLRWDWFMKEYNTVDNSKDAQHWANRICDFYFISYDDFFEGLWTYNEWAWAYVNTLLGHNNRIAGRQVLSYDKFLAGEYGLPSFDIDGNVIWPK